MYKNLNVSFLGGGESGVGKSSIISSAIHQTYEKEYIPTIENRDRKLLQFNKKVYNIFVHDTSSLIELNCLVKESITECESFVIVFSLDDQRSIDRIQYYKDLIYDTLKCKKGSIPIILVANKFDLVVKDKTINQKISKIKKTHKGLPCIECCVKDTETTNAVFKLLVKQVEKKTTKTQIIPNVKIMIKKISSKS